MQSATKYEKDITSKLIFNQEAQEYEIIDRKSNCFNDILELLMANEITKESQTPVNKLGVVTRSMAKKIQ